MKKIELFAGCSIDAAYDELHKSSEPCYAVFNGKEITSEDTLYEMYLKIVGCSKAEFEKRQKQWHDDYVKREEEHKAKIPELTEVYRKKARGIILEDKLELWDKCVPIRLGDLYHGMELDATLEISKIMGDETIDFEARMKNAYDLFQKQGHSGMSAGLVMSMLREFCPNGNEIADAIKEFRYDKTENK